MSLDGRKAIFSNCFMAFLRFVRNCRYVRLSSAILNILRSDSERLVRLLYNNRQAALRFYDVCDFVSNVTATDHRKESYDKKGVRLK